MDQVGAPHLLVVMGVCGSGKTTVGRALAEHLELPYADADDFHSAANVAKMAAGRPLDDTDRAPWLEAIAQWLAEHPRGAVVSCSALRTTYRDTLRRGAPGARFVHLDGDSEVIAARVAARHDHFMPASLIDSQQQLLEPLTGDEAGLTVDLDRPREDLVAHVAESLSSPSVGAAR